MVIKLYTANLNTLASRRNDLSQKFFLGITHLLHVLPTHLSFILYRVFLLLTFVVCIVSVYLFILLYLQCTWLFLLHISLSFLLQTLLFTTYGIFSSSAASVITKFSVQCSVLLHPMRGRGRDAYRLYDGGAA